MAKEDASATFSIDLENNTSGPAEDAASALEALYRSIDRDTKALQGMQAAMRRLQAGSVINVAQFRMLSQRIQETKDRIAQAQGAIIDLGGSLERTRKPAQQMGSTFDTMAKQAQGVGGPIGNVASRLSSIRSLLAGGAVTLGIIAVAGAFTMLAVAAGAATAALLRYGVAQANARRAELLRLEGLTKLRNWYGIAAGSAKELQEAIDNATGSTALGRDQVAGYAQELYRAGLRGQNLRDALDAMAIKAATQGEAAAKRWAGFASAIALSGGSVRKLADDVKARLGGIAEAQLLDLDVQARKLREDISTIFQDLKIEGFLRALRSITVLFSQSTFAGRALKQLAETMLQPMIDAFEWLAPLVRKFFYGALNASQVFAIGVLKLALLAKRTFGGSFIKDLDLTNAAFWAGVAAVSALAAGFAVMAGAVGLLMVPLAGVAAAFTGVFLAARAAYRFVVGIDWAGLGRSIVDGVVGGVKRQGSRLLNAVRELGRDAWKAFKDTLGIASPSKEFAKLGRALPEGVEQGVESGSSELERTVRHMVEVPAERDVRDQAEQAAPTSRARPSSGVSERNVSASAAGVTVRIDQITIQTSETTARGIAGDLRTQLEEILSGLLVQMGGSTS